MKLSTNDLLDLQKFLQKETIWVHTQLQHDNHQEVQRVLEHKHSCKSDQLRTLVDHFLRQMK